MAYGIGGGGGRVPGLTENPRFSLSKPADLTDLSEPSQIALLDQMLQELYESHRLLYGVLETTGALETITSGGDVFGPASAVDSRLAAFDGVTGKLIKDSGYTAASLLAAAGGSVLTSVLDVTEAQLEAFDGTGELTHIAAPAADEILVPLHWIVQGSVTGAYTNNPNVRIRWGIAGGTPDIFTPQSIGFSTLDRKALFADSTSFVNNTIAEYKGTAIGIDLSTALTGVGAATLRSIIYYVKLTAAY